MGLDVVGDLFEGDGDGVEVGFDIEEDGGDEVCGVVDGVGGGQWGGFGGEVGDLAGCGAPWVVSFAAGELR